MIIITVNGSFAIYSIWFLNLAVVAIGASCTEQSQCSPFGAAFCPGLEVFPRQCRCHTYAEYDVKNEMCVPKTGKIVEPTMQGSLVLTMQKYFRAWIVLCTVGGMLSPRA